MMQHPVERLSLRVSAVDLLSVLFPVPAMFAICGIFFGSAVIMDFRGDPKRLLAGLLMLLVGGLGCVVLYGLMNKQVVFDRSLDRVTISRFWLPVIAFALSDLEKLEYSESDQDSDGPVGQTVFVMRDGRRIPYNRTFSNNFSALKNLMDEGNAFLGIPRKPPPPPPAGPDFAKFKEILRQSWEEAERQERKKRGKS